MYSTRTTTYATYPAVDIFKRYAITVFIHPGLKKVPTEMLGMMLKGNNPDLRGTFTVVNCRTFTAEGKENCRVLSLDCTAEFLDYLKTTDRNYKFRVGHKGVYINGGVRKDSGVNNAPRLTEAMVSSILRGSNSTIMRMAAKRYGVEKEYEAATRLDKLKKTYLQIYTYLIRPPSSYSHLSTGPCLLYTSPSPRDRQKSRMPSSA